MDTKNITPSTPRAKAVYFLWSNMPRFVLMALVCLLVVLSLAISKKKDSIAADKLAAVPLEKPPVNTVVVKLQHSEIHDRINLPGTIEPWTRLELMAKISGTIAEVLAQEGDEVKQGDILAKIEAADYRIALQRAKAAYTLAKANFERDKRVFAKGVIPEAEMDARKTALETAKADYEDAELQLSRCSITAPIDGVVRRLDAKIGLFLSSGDSVAEILKIDKVKAVVGIPESDIPAVRKLDEIEITIQALNNRTIVGKRHFLSPSPTTTARLYTMELEIDNSDRAILPGMFIRADVVKQTVTDAITIPFYSVISRNDQQYVYIDKDGIAQKRNVTLGIMEKWMVEAKEGLHAEDNLIIEGHRDVEEGQKINVVKVLTDMDEHRL